MSRRNQKSPELIEHLRNRDVDAIYGRAVQFSQGRMMGSSFHARMMSRYLRGRMREGLERIDRGDTFSRSVSVVIMDGSLYLWEQLPAADKARFFNGQ